MCSDGSNIAALTHKTTPSGDIVIAIVIAIVIVIVIFVVISIAVVVDIIVVNIITCDLSTCYGWRVGMVQPTYQNVNASARNRYRGTQLVTLPYLTLP